MSMTMHTPSPSRHTSDYLTYRPCRADVADSSFSPGCQPSATPTRKPIVTSRYDSPILMLTPSPLRRNKEAKFSQDLALPMDLDDFSSATVFSTPYHQPASLSTAPSQRRLDVSNKPPSFRRRSDPFPDDEEGLFLRSGVGHTSLPLQTPERHPFDIGLQSNSVSKGNFSHAPKRKINLLSSSPNPKHALTPLRISQTVDENGNHRFATLAPLPAPRFIRDHRSPGNNVKRQLDTLKHMRITDKSIDLDLDTDEEEFSNVGNRRSPSKPHKAVDEAEVVELVSPDGHIAKRRARSRPVSIELGKDTLKSLNPDTSTRQGGKAHRRTGSNTTVSDAGSPIKTATLEKSKLEFDRMTSSATLFFGPAIVYPKSPVKGDRGHAELNLGCSQALRPTTPAGHGTEPDFFETESADSSFMRDFPKANEASFVLSITGDSPISRYSSPRGRIPKKFKKPRDSGIALSDDEADSLLQPGSRKSSVSRSPSPHFLQLPTINKPSASYSTSSDATLFDDSLVTPCHEPSVDSAWPDTLNVSAENLDEFIVKTLEAGTKDGGGGKRMPNTPQKRTKTAFLTLPVHRPWASAVANKMARMPLFNEKLPGPNFRRSVADSGGSSSDDSPPSGISKFSNKPRKSCPSDLKFPSLDEHLSNHDTAVRKGNDGNNLLKGNDAASRTASRQRAYGQLGIGRPTTKLSASQLMMRRSSSGAFSNSSDLSEYSNHGTPTRNREHDEYTPSLLLKSQPTPWTNALPLRPPSSNNSPWSNSPSRARHPFLHQIPNVSTHQLVSKENRKREPRFSLSSKPGVSVDFAGGRFSTLPSNGKKRPGADVRDVFWNHPHARPRPHEQPGRFERDFVAVDTIGTGEFSSAIKVRYKSGHGRGDQVYAVKKSNPFEGNRHRLRLREEVEVLQHLSSAAGLGFHSNVLGYVDSWEEDDRLFILTELCEYGNFAHFLLEYGHHFARLDEARVWKIFADVSAGLRFIHQADVAHFDLKPANVFITASGRFKIGDFGMAAFWPRRISDSGGQGTDNTGSRNGGFEREGDKMYLAAEVLQGRYGKEADIFSFGMMMLETATNIVVPAQGELWHKLREDDFSPVDGFEDECSTPLVQLIKSMMCQDPSRRLDAEAVYSHTVVARARAKMESALERMRSRGEALPETLFKASPLAGVEASFLDDILSDLAGAGANGVGNEMMDLSA